MQIMMMKSQVLSVRAGEHTLVAVDPGEAQLTGAGEVSSRQADAAPVRAAHIGRDVPHALLCGVGRHGDGAAVNHCKTNENAKKG